MLKILLSAKIIKFSFESSASKNLFKLNKIVFTIKIDFHCHKVGGLSSKAK